MWAGTIGSILGNSKDRGNEVRLGYNSAQNVLGGRNAGKQIVGQEEEEQGGQGGGNGLMDMIMGILGNKGKGNSNGVIQGGVGGTNTGIQTQNVLGRNRTFNTWSPYRS